MVGLVVAVVPVGFDPVVVGGTFAGMMPVIVGGMTGCVVTDVWGNAPVVVVPIVVVVVVVLVVGLTDDVGARDSFGIVGGNSTAFSATPPATVITTTVVLPARNIAAASLYLTSFVPTAFNSVICSRISLPDERGCGKQCHPCYDQFSTDCYPLFLCEYLRSKTRRASTNDDQISDMP